MKGNVINGFINILFPLLKTRSTPLNSTSFFLSSVITQHFPSFSFFPNGSSVVGYFQMAELLVSVHLRAMILLDVLVTLQNKVVLLQSRFRERVGYARQKHRLLVD